MPRTIEYTEKRDINFDSIRNIINMEMTEEMEEKFFEDISSLSNESKKILTKILDEVVRIPSYERDIDFLRDANSYLVKEKNALEEQINKLKNK